MTRTLIPTHGLRFVYRKVPGHDPEFPTVAVKTVLQQRFTTTGGKTVWIDVPTVDEPQEDGK